MDTLALVQVHAIVPHDLGMIRPCRFWSVVFDIYHAPQLMRWHELSYLTRAMTVSMVCISWYATLEQESTQDVGL